MKRRLWIVIIAILHFVASGYFLTETVGPGSIETLGLKLFKAVFAFPFGLVGIEPMLAFPLNSIFVALMIVKGFETFRRIKEPSPDTSKQGEARS